MEEQDSGGDICLGDHYAVWSGSLDIRVDALTDRASILDTKLVSHQLMKCLYTSSPVFASRQLS